MATARAETCTPTTVLDDYPCVKCLSNSQLLMALVFLLAEINGYDMPDDLDQLLSDSNCWNCLSDTQKLQQTVQTIAKYAVDNDIVEAADVLGQAKCLPCVKPGQLKSTLPYLICKYFNTQPT